jgi:hypothetical protein
MSGLTVILPQLSGSMFFDEGAKTIRDILRSVADDGGLRTQRSSRIVVKVQGRQHVLGGG